MLQYVAVWVLEADEIPGCPCDGDEAADRMEVTRVAGQGRANMSKLGPYCMVLQHIASYCITVTSRYRILAYYSIL